MRLFLDANVVLDCLVLESSGQPRTGKVASDQVMNLCDVGIHKGLMAWHSLPIIAYYFGKQHSKQDTGAMMDALLMVLEVPTVSHDMAVGWRHHRISDFEDALQMASAIGGLADVLITRNGKDFTGSSMPTMTPEEFLAKYR